MKRLCPIILISLLGCLGEENVDPGNPETFVKYYNGGFDDVAHDIKKTADDGFILLATTEVKETEGGESRFKIKLIKVDEFGTPQWTAVYPRYDSPIDSVSFKGRAIQIIKDGAGTETGFVIVGDSIQKEPGAQSHLRIMLTDMEGNVTRAKNFKPDFAVNGNAVAINADGNFVVLGLGATVTAQVNENMFLAELTPNLELLWTKTYGAGASTLINKIFIDAEANIFWAGTVVKENSRPDIRFLKVPHNSIVTFHDIEIGDPANSETGQDMCQYGQGFAVIGSINDGGDDDILFKRLTQDGTELASQSFGFENQAENGFSICQSNDGGLILLGSVDSNATLGRGGKDYYLIKINAFGDKAWERIFGSKNDDFGNSILSLTDGSLMLFGTTSWGGLKTLTLIKTNMEGNIE
jgi:hypothetical protein